MRTIRFLVAVLTATLLAFQPLQAQEKAAVEAFKAELKAVEAYVKEQEATFKDNPMAGLATMRTMIGKAKVVKTDGLPADLKKGYTEFVEVLGKMGEIFKGWPEKADEMTAYVQKRATEDPKFLEDFTTKMTAVEQELKSKIEALDALGKKYGFDGPNAGGGK